MVDQCPVLTRGPSDMRMILLVLPIMSVLGSSLCSLDGK